MRTVLRGSPFFCEILLTFALGNYSYIMKKSILLIATFALATLFSGCELYNRGNNDLPPVDPYMVEFEASYLNGDYYGDYYNIGKGNYYIYLSDKGITEEGELLPHGNYYILDITSNLTNYHNETVQIPSGTYTLDKDNSLDHRSFSQERSMYVATDANGEVFKCEYFDSANMSIHVDGIALTAKIGDYTHIVTYNHSPRVRNRGENGVHSTLCGDLSLALDDHTLYYYPCGDYYTTGINNWLLFLWPNSGEGDIVQFDVMATKNANDSFYGEYKIGSTGNEWSILKGVLTVEGNESYMDGSWYYTSDYANFAPFAGGVLKIVSNSDNTATVSFEVVDDAGNSITSSWRGAVSLLQ